MSWRQLSPEDKQKTASGSLSTESLKRLYLTYMFNLHDFFEFVKAPMENDVSNIDLIRTTLFAFFIIAMLRWFFKGLIDSWRKK